MAVVKSNVNYQRTVFISQILEDNLILLADLIPHCICNAMTYTSGHISGPNMFMTFMTFMTLYMFMYNFLEKAKKTNKTTKKKTKDLTESELFLKV